MALKDPTEWLEDLTVFMDDENVAGTAQAMESSHIYEGSTIGAAACAAVIGLLGGVFGGVTFSTGIRSSLLLFVAYVAGAILLLRVLHPLTVKLFGGTVAWLAFFSFFWTFLLAGAAVIGARIDSRLFGYGVSIGAGLFVGLLHGSLTPGPVRREDVWLLVALPLAPVCTWLATRYLRAIPGGTEASRISASRSRGCGGYCNSSRRRWMRIPHSCQGAVPFSRTIIGATANWWMPTARSCARRNMSRALASRLTCPAIDRHD